MPRSLEQYEKEFYRRFNEAREEMEYINDKDEILGELSDDQMVLTIQLVKDMQRLSDVAKNVLIRRGKAELLFDL